MAAILSLVATGEMDAFFENLDDKKNETKIFHKNFNFEKKTYCKSAAIQKQFVIDGSHRIHDVIRHGDIVKNFMLKFSDPTQIIDLNFCTKMDLCNYLFGILRFIDLEIGGMIIHQLSNSALFTWISLYESDQLDGIEESHCIPLDILMNCGIALVALQYHSVGLRIKFDQDQLDKTILSSKETLFINNIDSFFLKDIAQIISLPKDVMFLCLEYLSTKENKILRYLSKVPLEYLNPKYIGHGVKLDGIINYDLIDMPVRDQIVDTDGFSSVFIETQFLCHDQFSTKKNEKINIKIQLPFNKLVAQLYFYIIGFNQSECSYHILDIITHSSLSLNSLIWENLEIDANNYYARKETLKIDKLKHKIQIPKQPIHTITFANPTLFNSSKKSMRLAASKCVNFSRIEKIELTVGIDCTNFQLKNYTKIQLHVGAFSLNLLLYKRGMAGKRWMS